MYQKVLIEGINFAVLIFICKIKITKPFEWKSALHRMSGRHFYNIRYVF